MGILDRFRQSRQRETPTTDAYCGKELVVRTVRWPAGEERGRIWAAGSTSWLMCPAGDPIYADAKYAPGDVRATTDDGLRWKWSDTRFHERSYLDCPYTVMEWYALYPPGSDKAAALAFYRDLLTS